MGSLEELNKGIYERRFHEDQEFRKGMYEILCRSFFQKYIPEESSILEIGAGYCEFINTIQAAKKIALDINPDIVKYADSDVQILLSKSTKMNDIADESIDRVFVNNFFEHISRADIIQTLLEVHRVLKPGGEILIIQPNIRYCARDYWMFFDHVTPLDDRSIAEALEISGFSVVECIPRFLPFTTKSRLPKSLLGLKVYLKFPVFRNLLGAQAFIRAKKN